MSTHTAEDDLELLIPLPPLPEWQCCRHGLNLVYTVLGIKSNFGHASKDSTNWVTSLTPSPDSKLSIYSIESNRSRDVPIQTQALGSAFLCANSKNFWPGLLVRWTHSGGGSTLRRTVSADWPLAGLSSPCLVPVGRVWQRQVLSDGLALKVFCDSLKISSAATSDTNVVCYSLGFPSEPYQWVALSHWIFASTVLSPNWEMFIELC